MCNNEKKVCLIVGANSEIGVAIAKRFVLDHQLILLWHHYNNRLLDAFPNQNNVLLQQGDLCQEETAEHLINEVYSHFGRLDLLINCIGKNVKPNDGNIGAEIWDEVLAANLKPAFFLGKYYQKKNPPGQTGCMIYFSSTAGIRGIPNFPHYIVSKAGLIALAEYYAQILAPDIRVNTIAPGFVATTPHQSEVYHGLKNQIPLKRMATLSEIVDTVCYLAKCQYITGQTVILDGGLIL